MNVTEIEQKLHALSSRHFAVGGYGLNLVVWPGHWAVTTGGGTPRISASGKTPAEAFADADAQLKRLERETNALAQTLGITGVAAE